MTALKMTDKRLTADPLVGTKEIQHVLEDWLRGQGSQDVWKLLGMDSMKKVGWKVSPMASLLCAEPVVDLLSKIFKVCKNGVIPRKKLRDAFEYTKKDYRRINWTRQGDSDFFDKVDTRLRVYASWVRDFKLKDDSYCRFCRRISLKEKVAVDSLISLIELDGAGGAKMDQSSVSTCLDLVLYNPTNRDASGHSSSSKDKGAVFKRILSRKISSPLPLKSKAKSTAASASKEPLGDEDVKLGCEKNICVYIYIYRLCFSL